MEGIKNMSKTILDVERLKYTRERNTKDISLNVRIPEVLFNALVKRVDELKMTQSEYVRTLLSFENRFELFGSTNVETLDFDSVEHLINEKNESLWLRQELSEIQLHLDQRINRMSYLEASIKKTLKAKQKKPRRKKVKV